jgi:hypothetical protein
VSDLVRLVRDESDAQDELEKAGEAEAPGGVSFSAPQRDPRCNGVCVGTDRHTLDSPAKFGKERGTGRKLVYCTCCNRELIPEEKLRGADTQVITNIRPPKLNPELTADQRRVVCVICKYDVVILRHIEVL